MSNQFSNFVQELKVEAEEQSGGMSPEHEKQDWLRRLHELHGMVHGFLKDYLAAGDISISARDVTLHEDQLGNYTAQQIEIKLGHALVKLKPIGTYLIGVHGRVDMDGPRGSCKLVVVPESAYRPVSGAGAVKSDWTVPPLAWKFATPPPDVRYIELTAESFQDALMKVIRGG
jgi:hypothetical protein